LSVTVPPSGNVTYAPFFPEPFWEASEPGVRVPSFHVPWAANGRSKVALK